MQKIILSLLFLLSFLYGNAVSFTDGDFSFTQEPENYMGSYPMPGAGEVYVAGYTGRSEWVDVPSSVNYDGQIYQVTGVSNGAFSSKWNVRHVSLPSCVRTIYHGAFRSCYMLEEIDLTNCTAILPGAFHDCQNLKKVVLPSQLDFQFYGSPFSDCPQLKLELPSYSSAFREEDGMILYNGYKIIYYPRDAEGKVTIGDNMAIDDCAFQYCSGITGLVLPTMGESAADSRLSSPFQGCDALETVRFTSEANWGTNSYFVPEGVVVMVPRGKADIYRQLFYDANVVEYGYSVKCNYSSGCRIFNAGTGDELGFDELIDLENLTIRIEPAAGYEVESLKLGDTDVTDRLTGEMTFSFSDTDEEGLLTVNLRQLPSLRMGYFPDQLKVYVNGVRVNSYDVICSGEDFSLLILPADEYTVTSVRVDYKSYQLPELYEALTIENNGTMQSVTISYRSRSTLYTQLAGQGAGSIVVNGRVQTSGILTSYGDQFDLYFIPDEGSCLSKVLVGSEDVTSSISGSHYSCSANRRVYAYFEPVEAPAEATLTIKGVGEHMTRHTYSEGQQAVVEIIPEDNWTIEAVTLNGEDASSMLDGNRLTIPSVSGENTLDVVMSYYTGIEPNRAADSTVRVICRQAEVEVIGLDDSDRVEVFDAKGAVIYSGTDRVIPLPAGEVYIVATTGKSFKVML